MLQKYAAFPSMLLPAVVAREYNERRWWNPFHKRLSPEQVQDVLLGAVVPERMGISGAEIIAIAKLVCEGMGYACPYIKNL